jgi:arsenate reductase
MKNPKIKILFLCTGNTCRSQMAEGWARQLKSDVIESYSAGVSAMGYLLPDTVKVMKEVGIDISDHNSKNIDQLPDVDFDYVVTLCGHANETCPVFSGDAKVVHVPFDDPFSLSSNAPSEEEALNYYRRVRDEIKKFVEKLPDNLL